ncbi:hypothetical protein Y1Q_0019620 [Alligator mississippiensis]|uniref:Uncharacterized protein n=1 Tax=Alligator mississippiensis TaxID=8496 RepID=A0A151PEM3_ALLMI|nr:hypothetical protein Y1Q_0019620 [Alligator mississippiensis]
MCRIQWRILATGFLDHAIWSKKAVNYGHPKVLLVLGRENPNGHPYLLLHARVQEEGVNDIENLRLIMAHQEIVTVQYAR